MVKSIPMPETAYLRQCFAYDPYTGVLTWRVRPRNHFETDRGWRGTNSRQAGNAAGSIVRTVSETYIRVEIDGRSLAAHRVIYKLVWGKEPPADIDHHDGDGTNNRWKNLRPASKTQNACNAESTDGKYPRGVIRSARGRVFYARVTIDGVRRTIGSYPTPEEAHAAYIAATLEHHREFAHAARPEP
jgi:HNH endonuclease